MCRSQAEVRGLTCTTGVVHGRLRGSSCGAVWGVESCHELTVGGSGSVTLGLSTRMDQSQGVGPEAYARKEARVDVNAPMWIGPRNAKDLVTSYHRPTCTDRDVGDVGVISAEPTPTDTTDTEMDPAMLVGVDELLEPDERMTGRVILATGPGILLVPPVTSLVRLNPLKERSSAMRGVRINPMLRAAAPVPLSAGEDGERNGLLLGGR